MADANKSSTTWSFGQSGNSGNSGGLFAQANPNNPTPVGNLFGATTNPSTTSATSPFGKTSTAGGTSLFGGASGMTPAPTFGGSNGSTPFGGGNKQSGGGLFGQAGQQNNQSSNTAPSSVFSGFSTPSKPAETLSAGQSQASNMFGGANGGGNTGGLFGQIGTAATSAEQANTTTPTSKPAFSLFGNSTTPAGPPPSTTTGASAASSLFSKPTDTDSNNIFAKPSAKPTSSAFSFGPSKPLETPTTTSAQPPNPFASTASTGPSDLFTKRPAPADGGLFQDLNKQQDTGPNKKAAPQPSQNETSKPSNLFSLGNQPTSNASNAQATPSLFNMPKSTQPESSAANPLSSPAATSGGFNFLNKPDASGTTAPSTGAPSLFANLNKPQDKAPASTSGSTSASAPSASAPAPAANIFGSMGKPAAPASTSSEPTTQSSGLFGGKPSANLGASTAGPIPASQSRLKNKSMDDIINRWATDLSKYQSEFQQQAEKVAKWDRMLVENSEKIQKLYGSTLEAERATTEVERQLTAVEGDQEELSHWLDYYEQEVDSMISNTIGQDGIVSGPDQERERTYQLASRLSERLDEMGKDLTGMIEEINDASSTLSKHNKSDDPLSQVVRVLNSHLTQLQQIDQGAATLQLKVQAAQRAGQAIGPSSGLSGPSSDAADGFYRSYMGRR